jgi:hypothetical protein
MTEDVNNHVAQIFPTLVSDLVRSDVDRFDAEQQKDREARAALRKQRQETGMTAGELLRNLDGDPDEAQRRLQEDLARTNKEAQAAVAEKDKKNEPLPSTHFPPPPTSG